MRSLADEVPFDIPDSWEWVRLGSIVYNRGQITPSTDFCYIDIGSILEDCRLMQATLTDCTGIDAEIESLLEEIDVVAELTKRCIAENSQTAQNQNEYAAQFFQGQMEGVVLIDDVTVTELPEYELAKQTASVFQNPKSQFFNTDVVIAETCENVLFFLKDSVIMVSGD